jgi:hypothetical protein
LGYHLPRFGVEDSVGMSISRSDCYVSVPTHSLPTRYALS